MPSFDEIARIPSNQGKPHEVFVALGVTKTPGGVANFSLVSTHTVELRDGVLGGDPLISIAPSDAIGFEYVVVIRQEEALRKGWLKERTLAKLE